MAEFKTCEEYVLSRLLELEDDRDDLKLDNKQLLIELESMSARLAALEKLIGKRTKISEYVCDDGTKTLSFNSPWEKYDQEDYALMLECMNKYKEEN